MGPDTKAFPLQAEAKKLNSEYQEPKISPEIGGSDIKEAVFDKRERFHDVNVKILGKYLKKIVGFT